MNDRQLKQCREEAIRSRARGDLLRALADGLKCLDPQRYQTDCGKCAVCACK